MPSYLHGTFILVLYIVTSDFSCGKKQCDVNLVNCSLKCDNNICNDWNIIHCPTSTSCNSCDIVCNTPNSCKNITIFGHYCTNVSVHAVAEHSLQNSIIYAPMNGDLAVIASAQQSSSIHKREYLSSNVIYGKNSNVISVDCYNNVNCNNNTIYGETSNSVEINLVGNGNWIGNTLYCPSNHNASCSMKLYSLNGSTKSINVCCL